MSLLVPRKEAMEFIKGRKDRGELGREREKACMQREEERGENMSRLYREKPLGEGSPTESVSTCASTEVNDLLQIFLSI